MILDERSATNAARLQNVDWVEAQICAWTTQYTRAELMAKLDGRLPAGPVQNMADIFADDHVRAREMLEPCQPDGDNPSFQLAASPIKFSQTPTNLYRPPSKLGADNEAIAAEFGFDVPKPAGS